MYASRALCFGLQYTGKKRLCEAAERKPGKSFLRGKLARISGGLGETRTGQVGEERRRRQRTGAISRKQKFIKNDDPPFPSRWMLGG